MLALGGAAQRLPRTLARQPIGDVWNRLLDEMRRLAGGVGLVAAGLVVVVAVVWPRSPLQLGLVVAIVVVSWGLGLVRGTLVGIRQHTGATASFLVESLARGGAVVVIAVAWGRVGPSLALVATGLIPVALTLAWASPRIRRVRAVAVNRPLTTESPRTAPEPSAVRIALAQQLMGRSVLALWAITLGEDQIGFVVVAFAVTELTVNFGRIAQPHVIHQAESGHSRLAPWLGVIAIATLVSAIGGLIVVEPLFGTEYSGAVQVVVPLAIAQGLFAASIVMTGVRYVSDGVGAIRSTQRWMAATAVVTTLIGIGGSAVAVTVAFAAMAGGYAATSALTIRRQLDEAPPRVGEHAA